MAFKTFTAGEVLTAANVNDYLMEQAVIACTSATRPSSPNEGMTIYETDTDVYSVYNGTTWVTALTIGAWTDYSGSLSWTGTTNPAIGNGTITAKYMRAGSLIVYTGNITMGSTTTFGTGQWSVSLPVNSASAELYVGSAFVFDSSTATGRTPAVARMNGTDKIRFYGSTGEVTGTAPITWTTSDQIIWTAIYEAA